MSHLPDREPTIQYKVVAVTDELMALDRASISGSVMIHKSCREGRTSHNTARRAKDGRWYIRKGKRGGVVRFLTECEITYLDGEPTLYQFKTEYVQIMAEFDAKIAARHVLA